MRLKSLIILFILLLCIPIQIRASEYQPPPPPGEAEKYMPDDTDSLADGLWHVFREAIKDIRPDIARAAGICLRLVGVCVLVSLLKNQICTHQNILDFIGTLAIGIIALDPVSSLITVGTETIQTIHNYAILLLPVMTGAMAAQGSVTASAGIYAGTALFNAILSNVATTLVIPGCYIFTALSIANNALGAQALTGMQKMVKGVIIWTLKILLYVFTGYITITGVINGAADAYAIKAAKIAISGSVPVVGSIISDASETILVSAGMVKNATGIYGLFAVLSICISPFLRIGIQYMLLQFTAAICEIFGTKSICSVVRDIATVMSFILAATGTLCLLLLISIVCFMKGSP